MPEQIALLELPLIDASDRKAMSMVHDIGEGKVLSRPAKFRLTCNYSRIEVWVDERVFTVSITDLLEKALHAIEADVDAKTAARALAVHGVPDQSTPPMFIGWDLGRDE